MPRVKNSKISRARHNRLRKRLKGYWGRRRNVRAGQEMLRRATNFAFRDRKTRKRELRGLWIARINAAARLHGLTYHRFISGLKIAAVAMNRKVLADLAFSEPSAFARLAQQAKDASRQAASAA